MRKLRAVGFRRVSTVAKGRGQQKEESRSTLDVQTEAITAAVQRMGATLLGWYGGIETGAEGLKPEFYRLLADAKRGSFDVVVCYDPTRFSRNMKEALDALEVFGEAGV